MQKEGEAQFLSQAVIEQIKTNPNSFVLTREALQQLREEREVADQKLQKRRLTVILESSG